MKITVKLGNIEIIYEQETDPTEFPLIVTSDSVVKTIREIVIEVIKIKNQHEPAN